MTEKSENASSTPSSTKKSYKVGDSVQVEERGVVARPDGSQAEVTGGTFVLSQPGTYVVDGDEIEVKA